MMVVHCNNCFWKDIHAEVVGSGGSDIGCCNGAVGDMIHVKLDGHCISYVNVKPARVRAVLDSGFHDLESSCYGSNRFRGLHWDFDITNISRRLVLVFRFDHDVRKRTRLGMAKSVYDIVCSSEVDVGNYHGQLEVLYCRTSFRVAHQARQ